MKEKSHKKNKKNFLYEFQFNKRTIFKFYIKIQFNIFYIFSNFTIKFAHRIEKFQTTLQCPTYLIPFASINNINTQRENSPKAIYECFIQKLDSTHNFMAITTYTKKIAISITSRKIPQKTSHASLAYFPSIPTHTKVT